jgi:hypothetical protein
VEIDFFINKSPDESWGFYVRIFVMEEKRLWFRAKRYGWGWTPCTWQGWAVLVMYVFAIFANVKLIDENSASVSGSLMAFFPTLYILTVFLIIICYTTGEKPRWRWNGKDVTNKK